MNADLEEELGAFPELAPVVSRLRAARQVELRCDGHCDAGFVRLRLSRFAATLLAASVLLTVGFFFFFGQSCDRRSGVRTASEYGAREYRQTAAEMIASQRSDGSWQNDFLTLRNAELLRTCETPGARTAYKKAMRNLRLRGIL